MKKTTTLEELSHVLSGMYDKFPKEISKLTLTYDQGKMEIKLFPVVWAESIEVDFKVEKDPANIEIPELPPPPPTPPPQFLKVREGLPQVPPPPPFPPPRLLEEGKDPK